MKTYKKFLIAGAAIFLAGFIFYLITMGVNGWTVARSYDTASYECSSTVTEIDIEVNAGEVTLNPYSGNTVYIEYQKHVGYTTAITEKTDGGANVLSIENKVAFWVSTASAPKITINIPSSSPLNLDIELNAGTLEISSLTFNSVNIEVNAGTLEIDSVAAGVAEVEVNAGSAEFNLLQCTRFDCEVNAGSLVTKSLACDSINAKVSVGSAAIGINGIKSEYKITASGSLGSCNVSDQSGTTQKYINVECSLGSIDITFTQE